MYEVFIQFRHIYLLSRNLVFVSINRKKPINVYLPLYEIMELKYFIEK